MRNECIVGLVFVVLEFLVVIGETYGWIKYNSGFDSSLFIIFLILIITYHKKKEENDQINYMNES
ncbi:MAG: hypothetical protein ACFFEN_09760 [Candidatus Thorarchaeota archaeon]